MMHSFLIVTPRHELMEELQRRQGDDFQLIPLKSVATLDDTPHERVAAVMIQVPPAASSADSRGFASSWPLPGDKRLTLEARVDVMERRIIEECLVRNNQRRKETAAELGISRVTLYNKMKKFSLS